jgi:hypothetical protein
MEVEEKAKPGTDRNSTLWLELQEKTKDDPELTRQLEVAKSVMEQYSDTLQKLADS